MVQGQDSPLFEAKPRTAPTGGTESFSPRARAMDAWPVQDVLTALWRDQLEGVAAVRPCIPALDAASREAAQRLRDPKSRLIYVGAGTSGVLAALDGLELPCTYGLAPERLIIHRADAPDSLLAIATPEDDNVPAALAAIKHCSPTPKDVVVAVSAGGATPYTVAFARESSARGALVIGLANNADSPLLALSSHPLLLDTGPEMVAGSTRMKAGTAQKAALNMLSTSIMIQLGHVHDGMMVDMAADNHKLRARATAMVSAITGAGTQEAENALASTGYRVKAAVLTLHGVPPERTEEMLAQSGGHLRAALDRCQGPAPEYRDSPTSNPRRI